MAWSDGRGRWYRWDKKATVDEFRRLNAASLAAMMEAEGPVQATLYWSKGSARVASMGLQTVPGVGVRLVYSANSEAVPPYIVPVVYTRPHFGGRRPWLLCPHCRRRVRYLYGGRLFLCRQCHDLTYAIRNERGAGAVRAAAHNRRRRIAARLGMEMGSRLDPAPLPAEPRHMHWRTYLRLCAEYDALEDLEDIAFFAGFAGGLPGNERFAALDIRTLWSEHKHSAPECTTSGGFPRALAAQRSAETPPPVYLTLAELAARADVSVDVARAAVRARLLRADVGRGTRKPRYRVRLVGWLRKLATLRAAGLEWADIRAWTRRRWLPGHEHERAWPAGSLGKKPATEQS